MDWVLPTDEILNLVLQETQRSNVPAVRFDRGARENSIASRLQKLAKRFTQQFNRLGHGIRHGRI